MMRALVAATCLLVGACAVPTGGKIIDEVASLGEEERAWHAFVTKVKDGADQPDNWWLKTCAGWSATMLCGAVFGAGIDEQTARREDVGGLFGSAAEATVDYERRAVDASCIWNDTDAGVYTSIYRENLGCTLVEGMTEAEVRAQDVGDQTPPPPLDPAVDWPQGELGPTLDVPPGVDMGCVREQVGAQFGDTEANPRGITIVYQGKLIYEQYSSAVTKDSRLIGWSATKSVVNALIGILSGEGLVNVFAPAPVREWTDNRTAITTDEMLHMVSGTPWGFDPLTTTWCMFDSNGDCANYCATEFPLEVPPGQRYEYNSGSSYILSRIVNEQRADPQLTNFQWPKHKLFWPIGAHSMYIEYQPNQHFLGGALGYATARDWARFGLLFLRNGQWIDGRFVVPEGWVDYSRTGSAADPGYGRHWRLGRNIDPDMFYATGFRNENVYVFPNQEMVVTRHAMPQPLYFGWSQDAFLTGLLTCFPARTNTSKAL